ncbi:neutral zinc metallopeptidase [Pseudonocardia nigra]|uniref:neutral zinc metallopeptidase n=1 Tax=Pseudonocardia nigra TaxID=1921578 RepID=UPI001C5E0B7E|nr:neutral zinc metallopeptidase [Pseudonocardia nigra]
MRARDRRLTAVAALVLVLVVLCSCTQAVPGRARAAAGASTAAVAAPHAVHASTDALGDTVTDALQNVWREDFPAAFGRPWTDVDTFAPVDTSDPDEPTPPCVRQAADLVDQAFYCPAADAVVWDAHGLLPALHDRFGPAGVAVVLAHEVGHAVQTRLGIDEAQRRDPARYPTILLEAMADCYAGVALAHLAAQPVPGLPLGPAERDAALLALVGFRDPLGVVAGDESAHGNAFDRVSAFQDGYAGDARECAGMSLDNRTFTQRHFGSEADRARGGNLPLTELLAAVEADATAWFAAVVPGWRPPPLGTGPGCRSQDLAAQGPARYCAADGRVSVDEEPLAAVHRRFGDYAGATLVVSRYALAGLHAVDAEITGPAAGAAAVCLAGAYTGRLLDRDAGFSLSPGDLDEAVQVLLEGDWAARDAAGDTDPTGSGYAAPGGGNADADGDG